MITTSTTSIPPATVAHYRQELEDFYATIRGAGFLETDFSLQPLQWPRSEQSNVIKSDLVVVSCRRSGVKKAYAYNPYATWLGEFFNDLHAGIFNQS